MPSLYSHSKTYKTEWQLHLVNIS